MVETLPLELFDNDTNTFSMSFVFFTSTCKALISLLFLLFSYKSKYLTLIQHYIEETTDFFLRKAARRLDSKSFLSAAKEIIVISPLRGFWILIKETHLGTQYIQPIHCLNASCTIELILTNTWISNCRYTEQKVYTNKGIHKEKHGIS